ncbi:B3 domain-containing protein At3g19184 [Ricinus communis]|uniref:B3 domain-containing protein At3g19184 n=1 Tax=Ricinus communis TaxID=3988 RepID=UPI0007721864|nr:B3 domain-containing protein At3g19184 [Ricinus communis]|eukprot:XP_015574366.1 B3 domain-containing protein At3g19184 [Ricinus communis]
MVISKSKYEEIRQQRLAENKKRMEELNLKKLSDGLRTPSPRKSPMKHAKPRVPRLPAELVTVRRSSRFSDKPPVSYKEMALESMERPRRSYSYQRRDLLNRIYASDEVRAYAIDRAEKLQSDLESDFPSFVKPMLQSHVTGGFWLGLPVQFCKDHLPSRDEYITLVDENGDASETKYLVQKNGLSGGWRGFAIDHQLVDGDALVFQLVSPKEFKVFIIRANEDEEKENDQEDNEEKENDKEENADDLKNIDATPLDNIAKRTRASRK